MSGGNWKDMLYASQRGDLELVRYHIKMGANPNYKHPEFFTAPLLESVRNGHYSISQFLLENGAKSDIEDDLEGSTPLSVALALKDFKTVDLLNQYLPNAKKMKFKNILITGGNSGIGKATAENLLSKGHRIVITVRNEENGKKTVEELNTTTNNHKISYLVGDLSTIQSTRALAQKIKSEFPTMDVFISNAGVWMTEKQLNLDGLEMTFMVNYVAHQILCEELLPVLQKNAPARIINVNSGLYNNGNLNLNKTPKGLDFHPIKTYANSKFCAVLFNIELAQQLEGTGVTINAVHPGVIKTGLADTPKFIGKVIKFVKLFLKQPQEGAIAPSWLAVAPTLENVNGVFYDKKEIMPYHQRVNNEKLRKALMQWSKGLLNN